MGVDIQIYRAKIGTYKHSCGHDVVTVVLVVNFSHGVKTIGCVLFISLLLIMAGVEQNPGPKESDDKLVTELVKTTLIKVTELAKHITREDLRLFFKEQGFGDVKEVTLNSRGKSAIIEFADPNAVDSVLQQLPICILGTTVNVERFDNTVGPDESQDDSDSLQSDEAIETVMSNIPKEVNVEVFGVEQNLGSGKLDTFFIILAIAVAVFAVIWFIAYPHLSDLVMYLFMILMGGIIMVYQLFRRRKTKKNDATQLEITEIGRMNDDQKTKSNVDTRRKQQETRVDEDKKNEASNLQSKFSRVRRSSDLKLTKLFVAGIPEHAAEKSLMMFFENEKRQGGGKVIDVTIDAENRSAIVEFENSEAVETVLKKRPIVISGTEVKVEKFENRNTKVGFLVSFYENQTRNGGGPVKHAEINADRKSVIEFEDAKGVPETCTENPGKKEPFPGDISEGFRIQSGTTNITKNFILYNRQRSTTKGPPVPAKKPSRTSALLQHTGGILTDTDKGCYGQMSTDATAYTVHANTKESKCREPHLSRMEEKAERLPETCTEVPGKKEPFPGDISEGFRIQSDTTNTTNNFIYDRQSSTNKCPPVPAKKPSRTSALLRHTGSILTDADKSGDDQMGTDAAAYIVHANTQESKFRGPHLPMMEEKAERLPEQNESEGKLFYQVLLKLGLANKYPSKISIQDVIAIDPNEAIDKDKKYISLVDIPWVMLKRLICAHSECREMTASEENNKKSSIDLDNGLCFISDIAEDSKDISPIDIFTVVYQCCDPLMKQIIFQKMYLCKIAVPFLYKHWETTESYHAVLSVWPLRFVAIESKVRSSSSQLKSTEVDLLELETKVLAFARFGRPRYSKSKLLNTLLTGQGCKTFFNIDCPSGMTPRVLSNGQIETFWLPMIGDNKNGFEDAMTFLNMRGDLSESFNVNALSFIADFADAVTLITDHESITKKKDEMKAAVLSFLSVILVIADPVTPDVVKAFASFQSEVVAEKPDINLPMLSTHKGYIEQNVVEMASIMSKHITSQMKSDCTKSFQSRLSSVITYTLKTDEQEENCEQGRNEAEKLVKEMNKAGESRRWKQLLTPVHSSYSQQLGKLMKRREREKDFAEGENIDCKIKEVRQKQTHSITKTVQHFIDILLRNEKSIFKLKLFLCWLHFFIQREKGTILQPLMHEHSCAWEKLKTLKGKTTKVPSEVEHQEAVISELEEQIDEASFSVQHFFREVGHIYEAVLELNEHSSKFELPPIDRIGNIISKLVVDGHQLEVIDEESFYMPYLWTKAISKQVDQIVDPSKVMTLSVLGLQSSGKSTLLNTMFGTQFTTRTGRCTRGIHVQLIPTNTSKFEETVSPFSYVLVADTEGLRSPELSHLQHEHDNELATITTGIGDITMLNIMGENTSEIRDILQVIVHAFLRLKMTNRTIDIRKGCAFVHQNVTDTSASEKMISGLSKLMQTLDEMTKEAARSEGILEISTFNQVIEFDINSHVWYLNNLWQGNPPMARVNTEYSEKVVDMKCKILQKALQMKHKSYKSFSDIVEHTHNLWKGVLNEDFVFSFRNSLEIRAYMEMEKAVQGELWRLESFIRDTLVDITQNRFASCDHNDILRNVADETMNELNEILADEKSMTENVIKKYFENNEYKDIIIQWKNSQHCRIDDLCLKLERVIRGEIERSLAKRSVEIMTVANHAEHEEELSRESMKVANLNKGKKLTEAEIDTLFGGIWQSFLNKLDSTSYSSEKNRKEMYTILTECLKNTFKKDNALLKEALIKTSYLEPLPNLTKLDGSYPESGIESKDISFTSWQNCKDFIKYTNIMDKVSKRVNQIFEAIDKKIDRLCQINDEITELTVNKFMFELRECINDTLIGNTEFVFKSPFYVKIFVHVCRFAHPVFQKHNEHYIKTQGIAARLEQYRVQQKVTFEAHLSDRQSEDLAANLFSNVVEAFAEEWVSQNLSNTVTDELYRALPSVKNRVIIEICLDLLNEGDFKHFVRYLETPKEYASFWITKKCNSHLFDKETHAYVTLSTSLLHRVFRIVKECVKTLQSTCSRTLSMKKWIEECLKTLKENKISIQSERFRNMKNVERIQNVEYFTTKIIAGLETSEDTLKAKYSICTSASVTWTSKHPIDIIIKKIWGCPELCAFCSEPCAMNKDHDGSAHYSIQHRPSCCKGSREESTKLASLESCEFYIQSHFGHSCEMFNYICTREKRETCGIKHKYRDYKKYLKNWDIRPTSSMHDTSKFWMWFVATYCTELHKYHGYKVNNIPSSWKAITKDEAKMSLEKTYSA